ncbi:MAG: hypothetical protein HYS12_03065 [Planctomycetes bacterium]|nr:hypothetical protein [Planctomycetota bacterium]
MARDATARLYDVDANLVVMDKQAGTITFQARKGRLADLDKLHESIKATRLGDGTGMRLKWLEVTAVGEAIVVDKEVRLKVTGSDQYFVLTDEAAPLGRLREVLQRGEKRLRVTGRVDGWTGNLTQFSRKLPDKPRRIVVNRFEVVKP